MGSVTFGICVVVAEHELTLLQVLILDLILRVSMSQKVTFQKQRNRKLPTAGSISAVKMMVIKGEM